MYYTIYKTTNLINNKFYIGKHQTSDLNDRYLGSGKLLKRAIQKHGVENFKKEILFVFDSEEEMNAKEKELVVLSEDSYNLCPGGHGGFGYINSNNLQHTEKQRTKAAELIRLQHSKLNSEDYKWAKSKGGKAVAKKNLDWTGKKHTEASKQKMRDTRALKKLTLKRGHSSMAELMPSKHKTTGSIPAGRSNPLSEFNA